MPRTLEHFGFDFRSAWRTLRGHPGFALTAVLILAVGIGINVAVFTVVDATLFRGFRLVEKNDRLLYIGTQRVVPGLSGLASPGAVVRRDGRGGRSADQPPRRRHRTRASHRHPGDRQHLCRSRTTAEPRA